MVTVSKDMNFCVDIINLVDLIPISNLDIFDLSMNAWSLAGPYYIISKLDKYVDLNKDGNKSFIPRFTK